MTWKTAFFVIVAALVFSQYAPAGEMVTQISERCTDNELGLGREVQRASEAYVLSQESNDQLKRVEAAIASADVQRRKARCLFKVVERQVGEETMLKDLRGDGGRELGELAHTLRAHAESRTLTCHAGLIATELRSCRLNVTASELGNMALAQVISDLGQAVEEAVRSNSSVTFEQFVESYDDDLKARAREMRSDYQTGQRVDELRTRHAKAE